MSLAEEIEQIYLNSFQGKFPYEDCARLARLTCLPSEEIIPELDLYFATIAAYSSSALRLHRRSESELQVAQKLLSLDAYQRFPNLEPCRNFINPANAPELTTLLQTAENLRLKLLTLLKLDEEV